MRFDPYIDCLLSVYGQLQLATSEAEFSIADTPDFYTQLELSGTRGVPSVGFTIEWNPSNPDMNGGKSERCPHFRTCKSSAWDGKRCPLLERCPQFRGVGFHCTMMLYCWFVVCQQGCYCTGFHTS